MVYVFVLACLWSVVGALVFFVRANITLRQRLAFTLGTSLAFGIVGWVDISSIYHTIHQDSAFVAKASAQAALQASKAAN